MSESDATGRAKEPLLTPRLKLRPLRDRDLPRLAVLSSGAGVFQSLTVALVPAAQSDAGETFIVERRHDRALVGAGGYRAVEDAVATVELSLWISEGDWGRGYGTEIAHALIDRAFSHPWVSEVCGTLRVANERGRRLIEKCGFQLRGTGMARGGRGAFPVERFSLSRRSWIGLKAWGATRPEAHRDERRHASA
jgi:RimJ/RimL family protein N-acetyltransferase